MSTPPEKLLTRLACLPCDQLICLRTERGDFEDEITIERARTMAKGGQIEGVGPSSGTIRYVRRLRAAAMPVAAPAALGEESYKSNSSAIAACAIGVYKQRLREVAVLDYVGHRYVASEGEVAGFCYAHCGSSL